MSSVGFLQRIDDALNPIVIKELRQAVQSRFVSVVVMLFLALQLLYVGIHLFILTAQGRADTIEFQEGREVFTALQVILLGTCMLFLPLYTGVRLAAERNEVNTDLLFITTLKPRAIISGKVVSAVVLALLIFSACAPFMLFTFFLRGIDWPSILFIITVDFLVVIGGVQIMVFLAVVPGNRVSKVFLGMVGLAALLFIFSMALSGTLSLLWIGIVPMLEEPTFWMGTASGALGILGLCGLLFTWSVALISPPTSNRAWSVRLYLFLFWLVSGVAMTSFAFWSRVEFPFVIWFAVMTSLWGLYLMIAVNERQVWTARVTRLIPQRLWWRVPAFFLFSGSAPGVLYACGMMGLTLLAYFQFRAWAEAYGWLATSGWRTDMLWNVFQTMGISFLYTLCYGLTAVLIRDRFFPRFPPGYTWIFMLVLLALGSLLLPFFGLLFAYQTWRYDTHFFWLLANPFVAFVEFAESRYFQHQDYFFLCAGSWAVLVVVLNIPWFFRQIRSFRPLPEEIAS